MPAVLAAMLLAGCSLAPAYAPPATPAAAAYKEMGPWTPAASAADAPVAGGAWWRVFDDPVLDDLEARLERANPDLAAAVASHDKARAQAAQARSALAPEIDVAALADRTHRSDRAPLRNGGPDDYSTIQAGGALDWEIDLWGRLRNLAAAAGARAQASAADLAGARLSLQAELADDYLNLRALDAERQLLENTVAAYTRALQLTDALHKGGAATGLDVGRAQTQLSAARAQISDVAAERALLEHAVAALVGESASQFSLAAAPNHALPQPRTPVAPASVLLQRRPDIAAAERRAAAANAEIGVARAAYFPNLSLSGSGGWQTAGGVDLISAPNTFWMVGPQLVGPLFDAGRARAGVRAARAEFDQAAASYRSVVLAAFREVEDQLALANLLAAEAVDQDAAVEAARRTEALAMIRYRHGASDFLEVVTAQTAALAAERADIALGARRLQASGGLTRALGGGLPPQGAVVADP
jgi:multidrug efflux system outer membrane protein